MIYANDPRTPQNAVLHLLNRAAKAQQDNDPGLARELVRQALNVFEEGVCRHYWLPSRLNSADGEWGPYVRYGPPVSSFISCRDGGPLTFISPELAPHRC
jgi:hypothetical protein